MKIYRLIQKGLEFLANRLVFKTPGPGPGPGEAPKGEEAAKKKPVPKEFATPESRNKFLEETEALGRKAMDNPDPKVKKLGEKLIQQVKDINAMGESKEIEGVSGFEFDYPRQLAFYKLKLARDKFKKLMEIAIPEAAKKKPVAKKEAEAEKPMTADERAEEIAAELAALGAEEGSMDEQLAAGGGVDTSGVQGADMPAGLMKEPEKPEPFEGLKLAKAEKPAPGSMGGKGLKDIGETGAAGGEAAVAAGKAKEVEGPKGGTEPVEEPKKAPAKPAEAVAEEKTTPPDDVKRQAEAKSDDMLRDAELRLPPAKDGTVWIATFRGEQGAEGRAIEYRKA